MHQKSYLDLIKSVTRKAEKIVNKAKREFRSNLKLKLKGKSRRWKDCAFLVNALRFRRRQIALVLLKRGCSVTNGEETDFCQTPLYHAMRFGDFVMVKQIIRNSILNKDTNYLNLTIKKCHGMEGLTPLHLAVSMGNVEMVQMFLKLNISVNAKDADGLTPLHLAYCCWITSYRSKPYDQIIDLILSAHNEQSINSVNFEGLSHLHIACMRKNADVVKGFLERGANINEKASCSLVQLANCTPLSFAIMYNRKEVVKLLLQHNADVSTLIFTAYNDERISLLVAASRGEYSKCCELIWNEKLNYKKVPCGVSVDARAWESNFADQLEIISLLISSGCNLDMESQSWYSLLADGLYHAWRDYLDIRFNVCNNTSCRRHIEQVIKKNFLIRDKIILNTLLDHNVDINTRDRTGDTILHYLSRQQRKYNHKLTKSLIRRKADLNVRNEYGMTLLETAIYNCNVDLVDLLLKKKASVSKNSRRNNRSPLHCTYEYYNRKPRVFEKIAKMLIAHGVDVNVTNDFGITPLHIATGCVGSAIISLLQSGADVNALDLRGNSIFIGLNGRIPENHAYQSRLNHIERARNLNVIGQHILKLKAIGLYVSDQIEQEYRSYEEGNNTKNMSNFLYKCNAEIATMKSIGACYHTSLYGIILKSVDEMMNYVNNTILIENIDAIIHKKKFPIYGYLLVLLFKKACERSKLLEPAKRLLSSMLKDYELPILCLNNVLKYVKNEELAFTLKSASHSEYQALL